MSISTPNAISTPSTSPTYHHRRPDHWIRQGRQNLGCQAQCSRPQGRRRRGKRRHVRRHLHQYRMLAVQVTDFVRRTGAAGWREQYSRNPRTAFEAAIKEKRRVTSMLRDKNYHKLADQDNITVITGRAHFTGPHSVEIATAEARSP